MDYLRSVFLESPFWLGAFAFLLFGVVLFARPHLSERVAKWSLPVTFMLIATLFIVQSLVVTERETILARLGVLIASIENKHENGIADGLSEQYQSNRQGRDAAVARIMSFVSDNEIYDTRIRRSDVTLNGPEANMILAVHATINRGNGPGERHWGRWEINWTREADAWRITSIKTLAIDAIPGESLPALRDYMP